MPEGMALRERENTPHAKPKLQAMYEQRSSGWRSTNLRQGGKLLVDVNRLVWMTRINHHKNVPGIVGLHAAVHGDGCPGRNGEVGDLVRCERFDLGANFDLAWIVGGVVELDGDIRGAAACRCSALVFVEDAAERGSIQHGRGAGDSENENECFLMEHEFLPLYSMTTGSLCHGSGSSSLF